MMVIDEVHDNIPPMGKGVIIMEYKVPSTPKTGPPVL